MMNTNQSRTRRTNDVIALSPDGHFLAVGRNDVRVWDLNGVDHRIEYTMPVYYHNGNTQPIKAMRFVDKNTLEIISEDGTHRWTLTPDEQVQ